MRCNQEMERVCQAIQRIRPHVGMRCNVRRRSRLQVSHWYPSPRGDEMQLKPFKKKIDETLYPSPHGDEMQPDLRAVPVDLLMHPSPHGDEAESESKLKTVRATYPSPHGDEMQRQRYCNYAKDKLYPSPREDEMQHAPAQLGLPCRVSVPAWG